MSNQRFRPTEYVAPIILVLLVALAIVWLATRLWRQAAATPPEPRPGMADYRFTNPGK
jgi:hypothetical protein